MSLAAALEATVATLRRRPAEVLPFYALGAAVPAIGRVFILAALAASYLHLATTGRLSTVVAELASRDLNAPDPDANPEAFSAWMDGVGPVVADLFTPVVVLLLLAGTGLALLAFLLLTAVASAARYATVAACLRGEAGLEAGVAGVRRHWRTYLGLFLLEVALWILLAVGALVPTAVAAAISPLFGALVGVLGALLWLVVVVAARAVFALAQPAVVVHRTGVAGSLRAGAGYLRREPGAAIGYFLIAIGALVGFTVVAGGLSLIDASSVGGPLALFGIVPALELTKTGLFVADRGELDPPAAPTGRLRDRLAGGARRGLHALGAFVRRSPGLNALSAAIGVAGFAAGWAAARPFVGALEVSIAERLADHVPPVAAVDLFANNWLVAFATAFSGLAGAIPAAVSVWTNGFILGVFARLEAELPALVAFVVPHGLLEIPALLAAGALGFALGGAWWRTWRGGADRAALADAIERAFWVLVGIGVLLAVAALVEGFLSPYYWRPFI